jgi:hypothetical protein
VLAAVAWATAASPQADSRDEQARLRKHSESVREGMRGLAPFLRDTRLDLQLRTYYLLREKPDGTEQEAWAAGGWLAYRSGWLLDVFGIGATFYGAGPIYAPEDKDGTLLLKPGQAGYYVLGEAYAALRYEGKALLKAYRQTVSQGYINLEDNRMAPNTFEGVTLGGTLGPVEYLGGYLWKMKGRNEDEFRSMASQAGAAGSDAGVALAGVKLRPLPGLKLDLSEQYGIDTFNTVFLQADYTYPLAEDLKLILGGQFTDQRTVGAKLVSNGSTTDWSTYNVTAKAGVAWRDLTVTVGGSVTGDGNTMQAPWGSFPGYLSLIHEDFDRAREKAVLVGAAYDLSRLVTPGLSVFANVAWGRDAIDPGTRAAAPNQAEYDLTVDYRPPGEKGLWFRFRGLVFDQEGGDHLGYQVRVIVNWEIPLL